MADPKELHTAFKVCFSGNTGETIMEDLRNRFGMKETTFTENPYETAFREGQRSVVLHLENMQRDFNPEIIKLLEEQNNE